MPFTEHRIFQAPDRETTIWRYMGLAKFLSLLDKSALFFASIGTLAQDDPFEGCYTNASIRALREMTLPDFKRRNEAFCEGVPDAGLKQMLEMHKRLPQTLKLFRDVTFVNSWYMHQYESAAMWSLYLKSEEGIAIRSTFARLVESFEAERQLPIYAGSIQYIDYDQEHIPKGNAMYPYMFKRRSFEHEHELRALVSRPNEAMRGAGVPAAPQPGIYVHVELDRLIERVYVAPTAQTWMRELVGNLVRRYGLDKEVVQSDLASAPVY